MLEAKQLLLAAAVVLVYVVVRVYLSARPFEKDDENSRGSTEEARSRRQANGWIPLPPLRHPVWQGIGVLVSFLSLLITLILTVVVARSARRQEQAHLFIHPPSCEVSKDRRQWQIQVAIDNDGPPTAADLRFEVRIAVSEQVTLTTLSISNASNSTMAAATGEHGTIPWAVFSDQGIERLEIEYRDYEAFLDQLFVSDKAIVSATFIADPSFTRRLVSTIEDHDCPGSYPICRRWESSYLRSFFIHDVDISGDQVVSTKSTLWEPPQFR